MKNTNTKTIKDMKNSISTMDKKRVVKATVIVYDENLDILDAYTNKTTEYSRNINDFVIVHFSKNNKLIGLEFLDISKNLNIPKKVLKNLKSVEMSICTKPEEKTVILNAKMLSILSDKETNINFITTPMEDKIECPIC